MLLQYGNKAVLCDNIPPPTASVDTLTFWFANLTNTFWGADFGSNCFYDTNCLRDDPTRSVRLTANRLCAGADDVTDSCVYV